MGEVKLRPDLHAFIGSQQPAVCTILGSSICESLRSSNLDTQGRKEAGVGEQVEEEKHPFPLKKGRHEAL